MKAKRFVAIGLLTAAAIALVGCAIVLNKHKEYTPKTLQTDAYYNFEEYNFANKTWTIEGKQNQDMLDPQISGVNICWESNYKIQRNNLTNDTYQINIEITPTLIYYYSDIEQDFIENPITTNNNAWDIRTLNKTINLEEVIIGTYGIDGQQNSYDLEYEVTYKFKDTENNTYSQAVRQINVSVTTQYEIDRDIIHYENSYVSNYESVTIQPTLTTLAYTYETGYTTGYQNKGDLTDGNFIDIRNMMLSVLTMPFTFINQAFNVTLWEGTTYEFNIGTFIKGLIAIASILFIIRLFTSGFSLIGNYTNDARARKDTSNLRRAQTEKTKAETRRTNKLADKGK